AALAIRKASKGRTFTVHIQRPYVRFSRFDLVVMPLHDSLRGRNVLVARTALHRGTSERLFEAGQRFKGALAHLPHPVISVLVGGCNRHQTFSPDLMHRCARELNKAANACPGWLAVTPVRRPRRGDEA